MHFWTKNNLKISYNKLVFSLLFIKVKIQLGIFWRFFWFCSEL